MPLPESVTRAKVPRGTSGSKGGSGGRASRTGGAFGSLGGHYLISNEKLLIGPSARLRYVHNSVDGFRESGAGGLNLQVDSFEDDSLNGELGMLVGYRVKTSWGEIVPEARAHWNHSFTDDDDNIQSSFINGGGRDFNVESTGLSRDSLHLGATLKIKIGKNVEPWLQYDTETGGDATIHSGGLGLGLNF